MTSIASKNLNFIRTTFECGVSESPVFIFNTRGQIVSWASGQLEGSFWMDTFDHLLASVALTESGQTQANFFIKDKGNFIQISEMNEEISEFARQIDVWVKELLIVGRDEKG